MLVTDAGILIDLSLSQSSNAFAPIVLRPEGSVTPVSLIHASKAFLPISVTVFGMVTVVRDVL